MDQAEVARMQKRRVGSRLPMWICGTVVLTAVAGTAAGVAWWVHVTPHVEAAEATRESAVVEARSLKPPLETNSVPLVPYAMNPQMPAPKPALSTPAAAMPPWLVADGARSADLLRGELRARGAMQMGQTVRLGMLKVAELLAMDERAWAEGKETVAFAENETSALLLTFFLHYLDGAGDAAGVNAMRHAMASGAPRDQAVRNHLLSGRTPAELEKRMEQAYAGLGIQLQFTRRGGALFEP